MKKQGLGIQGRVGTIEIGSAMPYDRNYSFVIGFISFLLTHISFLP
jgi:hypothetical protein